MAGYVTVHRTYDPLVAEMLGDLLRQEDIDARVLGTQASAIFGAAQNFLQVRIDVPGADATRASEIIAAMLKSGEEAAESAVDAGEPDSPEAAALRPPIIAPEVQAPPHLSWVRALGIAPLIPGGGHFVARRALVGAAVLIAQLVAVASMITGSTTDATAGALWAVGLLIFDAVGGVLAVRAYNRGERPGQLRQTVTAMAALFGIGAVGVAIAPKVMRLKPPHRVIDDAPGNGSEIRPGGLTPNQLPFPLRPDPWAGH